MARPMLVIWREQTKEPGLTSREDHLFDWLSKQQEKERRREHEAQQDSESERQQDLWVLLMLPRLSPQGNTIMRPLPFCCQSLLQR